MSIGLKTLSGSLIICRICLAVLAFGGLTTAKSSTVISITGTPFGASGAAGIAEGWSTATAFEGVTISATLGNGNGAVSTGTAFLTTSIGPGTTSAQEIAQSDIALCGNCQQDVTLFSGLDLPAGSYWLTIGTPAPPASFLNWVATSVSLASAPGVSYLGFEELEPSFASFPAGGSLAFQTPVTSGLAFDFTVTSMPQTAPVPEPASAGLCGIVALLMLKLRKKNVAI